jgi:hypothetical protein
VAFELESFGGLEGEPNTKVDAHTWRKLREELILCSVRTEDKFTLVVK